MIHERFGRIRLDDRAFYPTLLRVDMEADIAEITRISNGRHKRPGVVRIEDTDVAWALRHTETDADSCSQICGAEDESTLAARRLEAVFKRLAREAGYLPK